MQELDPYFRSELDANVQVVLAARSIVLVQDGTAGEGVVPVASDRDLVVIADEVTIRGVLAFTSAQASDGTGGVGRKVQILARSIDSVPGAAGDARVDVSGGAGNTSTRIWAAPAKTGKTGGQGHSIWHALKDDTESGGTGGRGDEGQPGDPGGTGGKGGAIDIRCAFAAATAAILLVVDGGPGGSGLDGQEGGSGGPGGAGADGENYWAGPNPSAATVGGDGGPGGIGGAGGAAGQGGAPGSIRLRVRNTGLAAFGSSLKSGAPGTPGNGVQGGPGGAGGQGGQPWIQVNHGVQNTFWEKSGRVASGATPDRSGGGATPDKLARGSDGAVDAKDQADDSDLVQALRRPLATFSAMLLDRIQTDFLALSGSAVVGPYTDLVDRVDWLCALLDAYAPQGAGELGEIVAQRLAADAVKDRLAAKIDYYGHAPDWVPLGSIEFYQAQFAIALKTLTEVEKERDRHVATLSSATQSASVLDDAKAALTARQLTYQPAIDDEHKDIARLIAAIAAKDAEATDARTALDTAVDAFSHGVGAASGLSVDDLVDSIGQFAFLGHDPFQMMSMMTGQAAKLVETTATTVIDVDGQKVDKSLVISRLSAVSFDTDQLQRIAGGTAGIDLADPALVKLLAKQEEFDELCDKFWNVSGAAAAKDAFEVYVAAVQARNADIMSINESLNRLRGYVAGRTQTEAAIAAANAVAASGAAAGAPAIVAQLERMVARARADCIANLYLASRAYALWFLAPGDALATVLTDLAVGQPLAMTATALEAAGEQILARYGGAIESGLANRPITFPPPRSAPGTRGIILRVTEKTHKGAIQRLRDKKHTVISFQPARRRTTADENPFAGHLDVRLDQARCWVHGVQWAQGKGKLVRVDVEHEGRETVVTVDDVATIVRHGPVHVMTTSDSTRPGNPDGLAEVSDLQDGTAQPVGAQIGPFARWRVVVDPALNPGVDLSQVDEITFEFHGSAVWTMS